MRQDTPDTPLEPWATSPFSLRIRVYYEDTDVGGVVYHANYLRFFERVRTEWLRALSFEQDVLAQNEGVVFAVRRATLDYRRPARFNDLLEVGSQLIKIGRASLTFQHQLRRVADDDKTLLCTAMIEIVCIAMARFKPWPIPETLMRRLMRGRTDVI